MRVAELETLFTADAGNFDKTAVKVEAKQKQIDGSTAEVKVTADGAKALDSLLAVERKAEGLPDATVKVDADTSKAESELDDFQDKASSSGGEGGKAFMGGLLGGLAATPIAGAVVGLAQDIGGMFVDAFQIEVRGDRLTALTGLDPSASARLGQAAAEAYADNFGESLDANFDTARLAVQSGLLDPAATRKQAENVIASLSGVASFMSEDVSRVVRSTTQLLQTGLAKSADEAFDIIVSGEQAGLNISEDWLDTLDEYSTQFRKLGLDGPHAIGLISQGLKAGARDTDTVADALKEFSIRAIDGSKTTVDAYGRIGLSAKDMAVKIAAGGAGASEGLQQVLDGLRAIEDPVQREAVAVELFGTKAEDLGAALYALDFNTAADGLENFAGSAQLALDTMGDNAASSIESAKRNIEIAKDGILAALAQAFNPEIEGFATYVQENRAEIMQFLLDVANGALDFGIAFVNSIADGTEAVGDFASTVLPALLDGIGGVIKGIDKIVPGDQGTKDWDKFAASAKKSLESLDKDSETAADTMRTELIDNGLKPAQDRLNEFAMPLVQQAKIHDASVAAATDIAGVGYAADQSAYQIEGFTGELDLNTEQGKLLNDQLRVVKDAMDGQAQASIGAGQATSDLTTDLQTSRDELILQLEQMGLTEQQANDLADAYGLVPTDIATQATLDASQAMNALATLQSKINEVTGDAQRDAIVDLRMAAQAQAPHRALGSIDTAVPMALGGLSNSMATFVPPGTPRIVGDRLDVDEAFIPLDGSPHSWGLLMETFARMPGAAPGGLAAGAVTGAGGSGAPSTLELSDRSLSRLADLLVGTARSISIRSVRESWKG